MKMPPKVSKVFTVFKKIKTFLSTPTVRSYGKRIVE